jgi:hypothetical protein
MKLVQLVSILRLLPKKLAAITIIAVLLKKQRREPLFVSHFKFKTAKPIIDCDKEISINLSAVLLDMAESTCALLNSETNPMGGAFNLAFL